MGKKTINAAAIGMAFLVLVTFSFSLVYNKAMSESGSKIDSVLGGQLIIDKAKNRLMVTDKDNINKLLAGVDEDGNVRVKLAQDGKDVLTAGDDELVFSSDFNTLKIVGKGTATVSAASVSGNTGDTESVTVNFADDLDLDIDYIPVVMAYYEKSGQQTPWPTNGELLASDANGSVIQSLVFEDRYMRITDTSVTFTLQLREITNTGSSRLGTSSGPYDIKFYVFRETAN